MSEIRKELKDQESKMRSEIKRQGERLSTMEELLRQLHNKILGGSSGSTGVLPHVDSSLGGTSGLVKLQQPRAAAKEVSKLVVFYEVFLFLHLMTKSSVLKLVCCIAA